MQWCIERKQHEVNKSNSPVLWFHLVLGFPFLLFAQEIQWHWLCHSAWRQENTVNKFFLASSKLQFLCSHTGQSQAKPPCTYVVDSNHITTFFFLEIINQSRTVMGHFHLVCRDSCQKCLPNHYIMTNQGFPGRENILLCIQ